MRSTVEMFWEEVVDENKMHCCRRKWHQGVVRVMLGGGFDSVNIYGFTE